jgi:ADP-ribose pyrophosphatase
VESPAKRELLATSRFRVVEETFDLPDGRAHRRQTVVHGGAVAIVPMIDDDHVCLIRNRRYSVKKTLVEIPAGTLEGDEPPLACARRELIEETGYRAEQFDELCQFFMSPGIMTERMYVFVARQLTLGATDLDESEQIERLEVSWNEALRMIDSGEIEDAKTIAGLLAYDRRRAAKT